jgi:4-azaleucine resistance transporter AzlC
MEKECELTYSFKDGLIDGLPIVIGYVPIAMAFGILSKSVDITMTNSVLFSALVFAGASQFMALNLLYLGAGIGEIILTTLLVNLRHFLMSASLATRLPKNIKSSIPVAFGITDETFSVASFKEGTITKEYMISLEFTVYSCWVLGTAFGYIVGGVLPAIVKDSMGIALYAMFVAILTPEIKKSIKVAILAGLSGVVNTICNCFLGVPQGWSIIISIVTISLLGAYLFKEEREEVEYE